ncbi:MAG: BON domain-containing protein [Dehalococcoidia bacterium]|nr:BON domain-containing protein [Dehalococcoidia bacterium]
MRNSPVTNDRTTMMTFRPGAAHEQALQAMAGLDIDEVVVELVAGRLYLRGIAACYRTKQLAGRRVTEAMPGVAVVNELRVAQGVASDADVTRAVEAAIGRAVPGASGRISAHVDSGDTYIGGIASSESERAEIEAAAWQAPGVMHVHNQVTVPGPDEDDGDFADGLSRYIQYSVTLPHGEIIVRYNRGVVSLDGAVATAQQRDAVEELVRWYERVSDVMNNIRVAPLRAVR